MSNEKLKNCSLSREEELPLNSQIERFECPGHQSPEITETDETAVLESMAGQPGSGGIEALSPRSDYYDAEDIFQDQNGEIQMDLRTIREEIEPLQQQKGNLNSNGNLNGASRRYKRIDSLFLSSSCKSRS